MATGARLSNSVNQESIIFCISVFLIIIISLINYTISIFQTWTRNHSSLATTFVVTLVVLVLLHQWYRFSHFLLVKHLQNSSREQSPRRGGSPRGLCGAGARATALQAVGFGSVPVRFVRSLC